MLIALGDYGIRTGDQPDPHRAPGPGQVDRAPERLTPVLGGMH